MSAWLEFVDDTPSGPGELDTVRRQLRACARLCELLELQVGAAAHDDAAGLAGLQRERRRVEGAVRGADDEAELGGTEDPVAAVSRVMQHALDLLDGRSEEEQRLRDWITALQDASLPLLRGLVARPRSAARPV